MRTPKTDRRYGYRPTGLPARLLAFFEANPDEELSRTDIETKFSVCESTVQNALQEMRNRGQIVSVHVYRKAKP